MINSMAKVHGTRINALTAQTCDSLCFHFIEQIKII